jgi:hypothetical protein
MPPCELQREVVACDSDHEAASATPCKPSGKGTAIRARIAANREKRLAIAEAMKREAGVTEHTVFREGQEGINGLAYIGTGRILSPEGRKIEELYILAHECGHIWLHNAGEGYWYPGHLKEMEAESYAHQAFRAHGMKVAPKVTNLGRRYVAMWIAKDRAAGIAIDPRAEAYAGGARSPYEPLRMTPSAWPAVPAGWQEAPPGKVRRRKRPAKPRRPRVKPRARRPRLPRPAAATAPTAQPHADAWTTSNARPAAPPPADGWGWREWVAFVVWMQALLVAANCIGLLF